MKKVRLILGSKNDASRGNEFLKVLKEIGVECNVSIASCHRNIEGKKREFQKLVDKISEDIIVMMGGMELAAPGIIESILRNARRFNRIVFGIPLDKAARSAIENLPKGTAIITSGLNEISVSHGIINSALSVAKLAWLLSDDHGFFPDGLNHWYSEMAKENPLVSEVELVDGLIPEKKK